MRRSFIFPSLKGLQNDLSLSRFRRVDDAIFYFADAEGVKKQPTIHFVDFGEVARGYFISSVLNG